jgi:hypothetical protein
MHVLSLQAQRQLLMAAAAVADAALCCVEVDAVNRLRLAAGCVQAAAAVNADSYAAAAASAAASSLLPGQPSSRLALQGLQRAVLSYLLLCCAG